MQVQCPNQETIMSLPKQFSVLTLYPQMQSAQELKQAEVERYLLTLLAL
jgi:hypothetical protein